MVDERLDAVGVRLCVDERERRAPAAAKHHPLLDAQVHAQLLQVRHQLPRAVLLPGRNANSTYRSWAPIFQEGGGKPRTPKQLTLCRLEGANEIFAFFATFSINFKSNRAFR